MLLTIDAGNTRTKWAVFNAAGEIKNHGACRNETLVTADFSPLALMYDRVVISNVAGERHAALLTEKFAFYALHVRWITATLQVGKVRNGYAKPETLGSDRWAALIAAWHIKQAPCVVVNAGTAVTIDALSIQLPNNQATSNNTTAAFIGGLILPGLDLMQQSLGQATAQLPTLTLEQKSTLQAHVAIFATNTADAIFAGALHAILGAITLMSQQLHQQCKQVPYIILSGGNAKAIHDNLLGGMTKQVVIVDNLVLQGLYLLENFMQSEAQ